MNTYQIKKEYQEIMENPDYIDFETGEFTELWEQALKENQDNLEQKAENIARFMKNLDWESDIYKKEIDRLSNLKRVNDNKVKWLKKILDFALDWNALNTELFKFSYRKSESAVIENKDLLPWRFKKEETIIKVDSLTIIKKDLKEEVKIQIEEAKNDWKAFNEEEITQKVFEEAWVKITINQNLQIK